MLEAQDKKKIGKESMKQRKEGIYAKRTEHK